MKRVVWDEGQRVGQWTCDRLQTVFDPTACRAIGLERDSELIAGVVYDHYLFRSICMHVAAVGRHWLNREFLWAVFAYPFNQLGVNKVVGLVDSSNLQARRFDEHLGFQIEGVIKDAAKGGDLILYTMTRAQCRWLGGRKHG